MSDQPSVAQRFKHPIGVAVHKVLWRDWDPIGMSDWGPDNEYDAYVWPLIGKIMQGESVAEIAAYLTWASDEHMGCPQDPARTLEIAGRLVALRPADSPR